MTLGVGGFSYILSEETELSLHVHSTQQPTNSIKSLSPLPLSHPHQMQNTFSDVELLIQPRSSYFCVTYSFHDCSDSLLLFLPTCWHFYQKQEKGLSNQFIWLHIRLFLSVFVERSLKLIDKMRILHHSHALVVQVSPHPCFYRYLKSYFHFCFCLFVFYFKTSSVKWLKPSPDRVALGMLMCHAFWLHFR